MKALKLGQFKKQLQTKVDFKLSQHKELVKELITGAVQQRAAAMGSPPRRGRARRGTKRAKGKASSLAKLAVPKIFEQRAQYSVHVGEEGDLHAVMLNKTDAAANNNKFYSLALLVADDGPGAEQPFIVFSNNGRIGYKGQHRGYPFSSLAPALAKYASIFESKTGRAWGSGTAPVPGHYRVVDVDHVEEEEAEGGSGTPGSASKKRRRADSTPPPPSALPPPVQELVKRLTDVSALSATLASLNIDLKRAPLGKLSRKQLGMGYRILSKLEGAIKSGDRPRARELSNDFYSTIPHSFGFSVPPTVFSLEKLAELEETLYTLTQVDIAMRALKVTRKNVNPVDFAYKAMGARMLHVPPTTPLWRSIEGAIHGTHAPTHTDYTLSLREVFAVDLKGQGPRFTPFAELAGQGGVPPTRLLWHGSRLSNMVGILSQGLRVAPPEAPSTGYMFGKGIYFADCASKSANYCFAGDAGGQGVLLLSEVFTGREYQLAKAEYIKGRPPAPHHSTLGMGRQVCGAGQQGHLGELRGSLETALAAAEDGAAADTIQDLDAFLGPSLETSLLPVGPLTGVNAGQGRTAAQAPGHAADGSGSDDSDEEDLDVAAAAKLAAAAAAAAGTASAGAGAEGGGAGAGDRVVDAKGVDVEEDGDLLYNEYVVYSEDQCRLRFLCLVDFHFSDA